MPDSHAPPDLRERLTDALGDGFAIERELGGGGMSHLFLARDLRLGRRIAVKVLHPGLVADVSARRFEREVRIAAALQHPHVVPVLSAGEVAGLPYYTMPFVDGESLRERMRREGALPVSDVVRLLREVADALAHAHGRGVVHRDLKPENVLLSGGHAFIVDFGVAKALAASKRASEAVEDGTTRRTTGGGQGVVTATGTTVGTLAYMAPEQAASDPEADHRADLYSLGVIAWELLAGAHPFAARTPRELLAAHMIEAPPPIAQRRPEVPRPLAALVMQLLAKAPADRPRSGDEVVRALDVIATLPAAARPSLFHEARRALRWWRTRHTLVGLVAVALVVLGWLVTCASAPR